MASKHAEFDARGRAFLAKHPDYNAVLDAAHKAGLRFNLQDQGDVFAALLDRPDGAQIAYWLCLPENRETFYRIHGCEGEERERQIEALGDQLARQGYSQDIPTDEYLRLRKQAKRAGLSVEEARTLAGDGGALSDVDQMLLGRKFYRRGV